MLLLCVGTIQHSLLRAAARKAVPQTCTKGRHKHDRCTRVNVMPCMPHVHNLFVSDCNNSECYARVSAHCLGPAAYVSNLGQLIAAVPQTMHCCLCLIRKYTSPSLTST